LNQNFAPNKERWNEEFLKKNVWKNLTSSFVKGMTLGATLALLGFRITS
jgi:hypothetical protein